MGFFQRREREMEQKLIEQEEEAGTVQETYTGLQQEVEIKTKKLKKVRIQSQKKKNPTSSM